jgi:ElaB/YqjD/DUF883 family membrane-anchored ribosome-binding protein
MAANSDTPVSEDLESIKRDLREMRADFLRLARDVAGLGEDGVQAFRHRARERADRAREAAREGLERARERVEEGVRRKPVVAILAAFGAGFVLAALARRK